MKEVRADFIREDCFITEALSGYIVANCNIKDNRFSHQEQKEHGEFIVRAWNSHKDLLEACKTMVAAYRDARNEKLACKCARCTDALTKAEAAIAKATE